MLRTARVSLLIHHNYAGREFAYDIGDEKAPAKAKQRGWTAVSMQNDFKMVFVRSMTEAGLSMSPTGRRLADWSWSVHVGRGDVGIDVAWVGPVADGHVAVGGQLKPASDPI